MVDWYWECTCSVVLMVVVLVERGRVYREWRVFCSLVGVGSESVNVRRCLMWSCVCVCACEGRENCVGRERESMGLN